MEKLMSNAINACWTLRGQYGLYSRPARDNAGMGSPVVLVWAASSRDEANLEKPDHRIVLQDNGTWWVDCDSNIRLMPVSAGPIKLARSIFNMMFPND